ncbi:MAG: septum formation initiator family protein [Mogibacterium sp.]|nr:septum formation initiator family protein [Mogibacterium sp.]
MAKKRRSQFDTQEVQWDDEELKQRIETRRRQNAVRMRRRKMLMLITFIITFTLLATMCGKDIVRLKAENRALRRQQVALEQQRDELQEELKKTNNQEYIREQAKKQLKLLNPGEILFTFEEEEAEDKADEAKEEKVEKETDKAKKDKAAKDKADKDKDKTDKDKDGGSDG